MSKPHEKYKERVTKHCMFGLISAILTLVGLFVVFFVPFLESVIFYNDMTTFAVRFSFFDISKDVFTATENGGDAMSQFLQLFAIFFFVMTLVMCIIDIVRNAIHLAKPDEYTLRVYDVLKSRSSRYAKQALWQGSIILLISAIVIQSMVITTWTLINQNSESGSNIYQHLIFNVTGVNPVIIFPILVVVALIVLEIVRDVADSKIKSDIIKEEYDLPTDIFQ